MFRKEYFLLKQDISWWCSMGYHRNGPHSGKGKKTYFKMLKDLKKKIVSHLNDYIRLSDQCDNENLFTCYISNFLYNSLYF